MKRIRYSIPDEQWTLLEEMAKVLAMDTKFVLQMSTSIGIRFLDMSVIHPLGGAIGKAIDQRADQAAEDVGADIAKVMGQNRNESQAVSVVSVPIESKKVTPRKKVSRKGK